MSQIVRVLVALIVAVVVYLVLTAVVVFAHSALVWGLIAVLVFLALAFGPGGSIAGRRW